MFDTLTYQKDYDRSPILVGHQDSFLAPLPRSEVCGLFKLAGMPEDVINKKVFPLSLKGKSLTWFRLCDDIRSWNYSRLKLEFH